MRALKEDAVAIVVDMQERLLPHIHEGESVLANCLKLIEGMKILGIPLLVTQQYTKGLGTTVPSIISLFPDFTFFEKISFSCCGDTAFSDELDRLGRKDIILCGIETHVCVLQTCLDLLAAGKRPIIADDCTSSRKLCDKEIAIGRMRQEGARITTMESILFELTRVAGNTTFRSISGLIK